MREINKRVLVFTMNFRAEKVIPGVVVFGFVLVFSGAIMLVQGNMQRSSLEVTTEQDENDLYFEEERGTKKNLKKAAPVCIVSGGVAILISLIACVYMKTKSKTRQPNNVDTTTVLPTTATTDSKHQIPLEHLQQRPVQQLHRIQAEPIHMTHPRHPQQKPSRSAQHPQKSAEHQQPSSQATDQDATVLLLQVPHLDK